jgi:hypothetical protein
MTETSKRDYPNETVAVWRGHAYRAVVDSEDPDTARLFPKPGDPAPPGVPELAPNAPGLPVQATDLDEWYSVWTTFSWHGRQFTAFEAAGGRIEGLLTNGSVSWARESSLTVHDRDYITGDFALDDIADLTEHRTDHLAEWRERHAPH